MTRLAIFLLSIWLLNHASITYSERGIVAYKVADRGIQVILFGLITVWTIPYENIVDVRRVRLGQFFTDPDALFSFAIKNRWFGKDLAFGESVLIRKTRGWKRVTISPSDAGNFIKAVRRRVAETRKVRD